MHFKKLELIIVSLFVIFNVSAQTTDTSLLIKSKKKSKKATKIVSPTPTPTPVITPNPTLEALKKGEPCDTKEDLLKKLEEEKKKQKAFSLQGGNTGCSVDKK